MLERGPRFNRVTPTRRSSWRTRSAAGAAPRARNSLQRFFHRRHVAVSQRFGSFVGTAGALPGVGRRAPIAAHVTPCGRRVPSGLGVQAAPARPRPATSVAEEVPVPGSPSADSSAKPGFSLGRAPRVRPCSNASSARAARNGTRRCCSAVGQRQRQRLVEQCRRPPGFAAARGAGRAPSGRESWRRPWTRDCRARRGLGFGLGPADRFRRTAARARRACRAATNRGRARPCS